MADMFGNNFNSNGFGGNANNNVTYFKPSSDGLVMFNEDNMMLSISYYDNFMKFELREKNLEGKYPKPEPGRDICILLNEEKATTLKMMLDAFEEKLNQYNNDFADGKDCSDYKEYSISVHTGMTSEKTRILQISTGTVTEHGFTPIIYIHIGVDDHMAAIHSFKFKTKFTPGFINYDSSVGSAEALPKLAQYEIISLAIRNFCMMDNRAGGHFNKTFVNDDRANKSYKMLISLMENAGLQMPDANYNAFSRPTRSTSPFDSFASNSMNNMASAATVIEGGDIGTLLGTPNS